VTGLSSFALDELRAASTASVASRVRVVPSELREVVLSRSLQTVAGAVVIDDNGVCFLPRFPFLPRTGVTVLLAPELTDSPRRGVLGPGSKLTDFVALSVVCPDNESEPSTAVVDIRPGSAEIPRNQLRLYIEFSHRMAEGHVADCVRVHRADTGTPIPSAFLPTDPELWDPERRRVTVLFDPARLKRGLAPHCESGYPLQVGVDVEVVVEREFRDARGTLLVGQSSRRYRVGPDVRRRVRTADWELSRPSAGTTEPLTVRFDRPLDYALLQHSLRVVDQAGREVGGRVALSAGEQEWTFTPNTPWRAGRHLLVVRAILEDLAGNSLGRVFDRDLALDDAPLDVDSVSVEFVPRQ
jgi:hypothetical protein